jgi:hypothetical protein
VARPPPTGPPPGARSPSPKPIHHLLPGFAQQELARSQETRGECALLCYFRRALSLARVSECGLSPVNDPIAVGSTDRSLSLTPWDAGSLVGLLVTLGVAETASTTLEVGMTWRWFFHCDDKSSSLSFCIRLKTTGMQCCSKLTLIFRKKSL